jgi:hypothetical protein
VDRTDDQGKSEAMRTGPVSVHPVPPQEAIGPLRATILSIEWEINDRVMEALLKETERLEKLFSSDFTTVMMLKLLGSVGRYILARKGQAHQGAIGLLNSIFQRLESMVTTRQMAESEKKQFLLSEIQKFKELKTRIASQRADDTHEARPRPIPVDSISGNSGLKEEIRGLIRSELADIRRLLEQIKVELTELKQR